MTMSGETFAVRFSRTVGRSLAAGASIQLTWWRFVTALPNGAAPLVNPIQPARASESGAFGVCLGSSLFGPSRHDLNFAELIHALSLTFFPCQKKNQFKLGHYPRMACLDSFPAL